MGEVANRKAVDSSNKENNNSRYVKCRRNEWLDI